MRYSALKMIKPFSFLKYYILDLGSIFSAGAINTIPQIRVHYSTLFQLVIRGSLAVREHFVDDPWRFQYSVVFLDVFSSDIAKFASFKSQNVILILFIMIFFTKILHVFQISLLQTLKIILQIKTENNGLFSDK